MMGNGTMRSEWNFDETIRGTIKGVPLQLDLAQMEDDEWDLEEEEAEDENEEWAPTRRHGSVLDATTINVSVAWDLHADEQSSQMSLPMLERSSHATPPLGSSPQTPTSDILDFKTVGSSSASGKSTWKQRHDQARGMLVKEGDLGDGSVGTIVL